MALSQVDAPERLIDRVQELQDLLDGRPDHQTREIAEELVASVVQMYGAGLEQIVARLLAAGEAGQRTAVELTEDPLVATLLLIHDLHPIPLEDRVQSALDSVRPYMESHGGGVELLSLDDGVARIHLRGSCSDCSASSVTLELAVKQALEDAAPDLAGLEVEGVAPQMTGLALPMSEAEVAGPAGLELPMVIHSPNTGTAERPPVATAAAWAPLPGVADLTEGTMRAASVQGAELVVANVEGTLLAYRDSCTACGSPLRDGVLSAGTLACPACDRRFFLPRAGRSLDADRIQLEPVPLLREQDEIRVAVPAPV